METAVTITRAAIEKAIEACIRSACNQPSGEWYAVTLHNDGHIEHRCGMGSVTYSDAEYNDEPGADNTIYVCDAIPDVDPSGEWIDPDTNDLDEDSAIADIIHTQMENVDWQDIEQQVETMGLAFVAHFPEP